MLPTSASSSQLGSLRKLFGAEGAPTVVSDSEHVRRSFEALGFPSSDLNAVCNGEVAAPRNVLFVTCDPDAVPARTILNKAFGDSAVMIIPLLSFSADRSAVDYLLTKLLQIDFQSACKANLRMVEVLERNQAPIRVLSGPHELTVELSSELEIALPKLKPAIARGEWVSVGQFLEVGLVPNKDYTAFVVNGDILCDGAAVAHHRHNYQVARPLAQKAWSELMAWRQLEETRMTSGFPLKLSVVSSRVTQILTATGECILDRLLPFTDETFKGLLIEVAFASINAFEEVDWSINSQLNEAAGGFHIALGTGVDAAHIDFISSKASIITDASPTA